MGRSAGIKCGCGHPSMKYERDNDNTVYIHCNGCGRIDKTSMQWNPAIHENNYSHIKSQNNDTGISIGLILVAIGLFIIMVMFATCSK